MIQILLLILKIVGILLLVLLGLVLFVLLTVLFVPVRYRAEGSRHGEWRAKGRVSWLFRAVSLQFSFENGSLTADVRLFGRRVGASSGEDSIEEDFQEISEPPLHTASLDRGETDGKEETDFPAGTEGTGKKKTAEIPASGAETEENVKTSGSGAAEEETPKESDAGAAAQKEEIHPDAGAAPGKTSKEPERPGQEENQTRPRPSGRETSKGRPGRKSLMKRLASIPQTFRKTFRRLRVRLRDLLEKKERALAFLKDEENRRTFRLVKAQLGRLIRHVSPRHIEGNLTFGFDDPYRTGQVLSAAALLYPVYRDRIRLVPVFDREVLEGELCVAGRLRAAAFAGAAVRLMMDRNFRKLLRQLMDR